MTQSLIMWGGFIVFVLAMLAIDLGVFNRKAHEVHPKEALIWTGVWMALALSFNAGIYVWSGRELALQFLSGYLIEKSLSVDNIFVFLTVFSYFAVPPIYQHRVLFWGIIGALVMRALMIGAGAALLHEFHWIIYVFGALLLVTAFRMVRQHDTTIHPERNPMLRLVRRWLPVTDGYREARFFVREQGTWHATPLFVTLVVIESTDLLFAVDSIPAIFAVTDDPFIVYTSNVFAVLGLRALYFALASQLARFHLFGYGLAAVLAFVGIKMLLKDVYKIPIGVALGTIAAILAVAMAASLLFPKRPEP